MLKKVNWLVSTVFIFLTVFLFRDYFFKGLVPLPANLLVSYYSPWRDYGQVDYPNGPANKPIGFDVVKLFYPYRKFTIDQLKSGQWPLWNPYNFSGNVHLATYQSAVFYPLNLVYFVLPLIDAWSFLVIIQPILAGFFTYLFLREIKLSIKAAFFGGLVFAFSGRMISWLEESLVIEHSFLWLPLILYAVEKMKQKITANGIALFVLVVASSILAGFLQMTLYVMATVLAWALFRKVKLFYVVGGGLLAFLIAAPHFWPAVEAYLNSLRGMVNAKFLFDQYLMLPWHLITFLVPDFWGNQGTYNYFGGGFQHEKIIFLGIPALLLALQALWLKSKNGYLPFFKWLSLLTLAFGFFPVGWLLYYSHLPLLPVMLPARILFLATFGWSVLAAFGLDFYLNRQISWTKWKKLFLVILAIFLVALIFVIYKKIFFPQEPYGLVSWRNLIWPILLFGITIVVIKRGSFVGIVAVTIFSLFYFANKFLYFSERRFVFPEVPVISKLKEVAGWDRVWGVGGGHLEKNMNIYYGLYSPEGYDALFSRRYGELLAGPGQSIGRTDADIEALSSDEMILGSLRRKRLLALLGVKYVVESKLDKNILVRFPEPIFDPIWEDDKFRIWEFKEVLPRAFLVTDYVVEGDGQRIINTFLSPDFDLRKRIVLEKEPGFKIEAGQAPPSLAKIIKYTPTKMEIETSSRRAGILFLSDNYYPGWRALVDGKETEILRANYTFRSVVVPKGEHQIVFSYEPKTFYWSLKVSGLAGVVFGGWLIFVRIKRR